MKQISLHQIIIKNFKSYKNECFVFSTNHGLKYLGGINSSEPRLGANGAGKSSLWEAICWCTFGSGIKGAKTSAILSWEENLAEVLVEYMINGGLHSIYRSGPPMKIELDGKPGTQDQIDKLLSITKEPFLHAVIFGQGVPLFPDLATPDRSSLLNDVLQLDIWEKASEMATKKVGKFEKSLLEKTNEISYLAGQISQLKTDEYIQGQIEYWTSLHEQEISRVEQQANEWESNKLKKIIEIDRQIEEWATNKQTEIQNKFDQIDDIQRQIANIDEILLGFPEKISSKLVNDLTDIIKSTKNHLAISQKTFTQLETRKNLIVEDRNFWFNHAACPTCLQPITEEQKCKHVQENEIIEQQLVHEMSQTDKLIEEAKVFIESKQKELDFFREQSIQLEEQTRSYQKDKTRLNNQLTGTELVVKIEIKELDELKHPFVRQKNNLLVEGNPFETQLQEIKKRVNPYIELLAQNKQQREHLDNKRKLIIDEVKKIESSIVAAQYWKHGFKRIRLFFINQILAVLEIEIQSAVSALGLEKWSVKLATETLTKSETIKLGVQIHIKSPVAEGNWEVWSGGESQRLRLAIAMGLASLIQRALGVFFNWECWDEPTAHLSGQGVEDLLQALQHRADTLKKSVWVTEHSGLTYSGFTEVRMVVKDKTGSHIT